MTSAETIDFLYQRELVRDVLARYCRAIDRLDEDLLRSVYFEDAWDDHGPFKGTREEFIAWIIPFLRQEYMTTSHHITTQLVEIDGDVANVESYAIVVQDRMHQARRCRCTAHSRYVDRLERRNGEWRIARRVVVTDSASTSEAPPWLGTSAKALGGNGLRDRSDPCYTCFESQLQTA